MTRALSMHHNDSVIPDSILGSRHISSNATIPTQLVAASLHRNSSLDNTYTLTSIQPYVRLDCWQNLSAPNDNEFVYFGPEKGFLNKLVPVSSLATGDYGGNLTIVSGSQVADVSLSDSNMTNLWLYRPDHSVLLVNLNDIDPMPYGCTIDAYWLNTSSTAKTRTITNEGLTTLLSSIGATKPITFSKDWATRVANITAQSYWTSKPNYILPYTVIPYLAQAAALALSNSPTLSSLGIGSDFQGSLEWSYAASCDIFDHKHYVSDMNFTTCDSSKLPFSQDALKAYTWDHDFEQYDHIIMWDAGLNDTADLAVTSYQEYLTGYSYNSNDITAKLSLAVLSTYTVIVIGYLGFSLITGYTATSWDSIAELVTLALNSTRPGGMAHTSVGIDTLDTFRRPVRIRVADDNSCELLFDMQGTDWGKVYKDVEVNQQY